jgi:hypothetical protein
MAAEGKEASQISVGGYLARSMQCHIWKTKNNMKKYAKVSTLLFIEKLVKWNTVKAV